MLAPRIDVKAAARVGGTSIFVFLKTLEDIGFEVEYNPDVGIDYKQNRTEIMQISDKDPIVDLDVRPVLDAGVDPFKLIMETLKTLKDSETLRIINTFEPVPLLNILKDKGYTYVTERPEAGVVHTYLHKAEGQVAPDEGLEPVAAPDLSFDDLKRRFEGKLVELDVRDMEMPMPMVTILEALETLGEGQALFVFHKRLPQYLLPELEKRGFLLKSQELDADNLHLIIYRKA